MTPTEIMPSQEAHGNSVVLLDSSAINPLPKGFFDPEWLEREGHLFGRASGRGETFFFRFAQRELVLRHYRRGGLFALLMKDRYLGWRVSRTRPWREWHLLARLYEMGLPVPRPVAARVTRELRGYRGDLVTCRIDAASLASHLSCSPLEPSGWEALGACLRRFHHHGVFHADLNAHNILISSEREFFLLDFDRGRILPPGAWRRRNLLRLQRSFLKLQGLHAGFHFSPGDWSCLLRGYSEASSR